MTALFSIKPSRSPGKPSQAAGEVRPLSTLSPLPLKLIFVEHLDDILPPTSKAGSMSSDALRQGRSGRHDSEDPSGRDQSNSVINNDAHVLE
jgi:hypothetical protein